MKRTDAQKIEILLEALKAAQDHLEYCGYGDNYERECALKCDDPLDKKIERAIEIAEGTEALKHFEAYGHKHHSPVKHRSRVTVIPPPRAVIDDDNDDTGFTLNDVDAF